MTFTRVTIFLQELLHQIHYSTSLNLSGKEIIFLTILGLAAWIAGRKRPRILPGYCIFLILYITLLRRAPGYDESIRWNLRFWPRAGIWAGNLLNILLYIPLGWNGCPDTETEKLVSASDAGSGVVGVLRMRAVSDRAGVRGCE